MKTPSRCCCLTLQIYNLYFNYQKNFFLFYRKMAKNSVFGSKDSYFGRIFDLSHFFGRNV